MKHEALLLLTFERLKPLRIVCCAQGCGYKCLSFTTSKECRTVCTRQHSNFDRNCPNLVKRATVGTNAILRDLLAEDCLAKMLVILRKLLLRVGVAFGKFLRQLVLNVLDEL